MITAADIEKLQLGSSHWTYEDTERWCPDCDQTKPLSMFYTKRSGPHVGISPRCKACDRLKAERRKLRVSQSAHP